MVSYTTTDAKRWINKSITTIIRWCEQFSDHLSSTATAGDGETRLFTRDDMLVLWTIYAYREQRMSTADISDRLASGVRVEPSNFPDETAVISPTTPEQHVMILQDEIAELNEEIAALRGDKIALEARNKTLEEMLQQERDRLDKLLRDLYSR